MSTTTANLGLVKPDQGEQYNVDVTNANMDVIDTAIKNAQDAIASDWVDCTSQVSIRTDTGTGPAAGTTVNWAAYRKQGKTVMFKGEGSLAASTATTAAVMLPPAGTPVRRYLMAGMLLLYGAAGTTPSDQCGAARMTADLSRIVAHSLTGGFRGAGAGCAIMWEITYEVTA